MEHHHTHSAEEELPVLLGYFLDHNKSHTSELIELEPKLAEVSTDAAEKLREAAVKYEEGNALLADALRRIR